MKKSGIILFVVLQVIQVFSQVAFEKGYMINNERERIDCYIKNMDKLNNPNHIVYKKSMSDIEEIGWQEDFKEFGIGSQIRFIRGDVRIDRSRSENVELSKERKAILERDTLYLRVLVEGKASLYSYQERTLSRFFYKKENEGITQLVYKKYLVGVNKIGTNNRFRQQLKTTFPNNKTKDVDRLSYSKKDLVNFFESYNLAEGAAYKKYERTNSKRKLFNLWAKVDIMNGSLTYERLSDVFENKTKFDQKLNYEFGLTFEYIFPFQKNKWSLLLEPTLQSLSGESNRLDALTMEMENVKLDFKSLEVPLGLRYYIYHKKESKLFLNAHFVMNWFSETTMDFERSNDLFSNRTNGNLSFGGGYIYNRLGIEFRYKLAKNLLADYRDPTATYNGLSVIFNVRIL